MALLTQDEARTLLQKVLSFSKADECQVSLNGSAGGNIRYALNSVSTSGNLDQMSLGVSSVFGKRLGTATINEYDDASLEKAVRRSEEMARLAPENPEFMPFLGPQNYDTPSHTYVPETAAVDSKLRADLVQKSLQISRDNKLSAAGYLENSTAFYALMNSHGLFAYTTNTAVNFSVTLRTEDGTGSGYATRGYNDISKLDVPAVSRTAAWKASKSTGAKALEPGKYTVILEPAAGIVLLENLYGNLDARSADEGRSFLSKKGGGTRLGEKLFDERVTIYTDPWDAQAPVLPWNEEDTPRRRMPLVTRGRIDALHYSRYWAAAKGKAASGGTGNVIMAGGEKSTADLVKSTAKGLLITRTHYVNMVDPQTMQLTGLTRDGTFYVENGEIKYPVRNFRFNESVVIALNNVEDIGRPERTVFFFDLAFPMMLPAIKLRDFTFTSLSDAI